MEGPDHTCPICGKSYSSLSNFRRHVRQHMDDKLQCKYCTYATERPDLLSKHYTMYHGKAIPPSRKRPHNPVQLLSQDEVDQIPGPSGSGRDERTIIQPAGRTNLDDTVSGLASQGTSQPANGQTDASPSQSQEAAVGAGLEQPSIGLEAEDLDDSLEQPALGLEPEQLDVDLPEDRIIRENYRLIQTYRRVTNRLQDRYNFELTNASSSQLRGFLDQILAEQKQPFKLNASFGYVLLDTLGDELSYHYASQNTRILDSPILIRNSSDVDRFMQRLRATDLLEYARSQRPNTKFVVRMVTNVLFYVDKLLNFHIGYAVELPLFLRSRRCVISLNKNRDGALYKDHMCIFRCYHYHIHGTAYPLDTTIEAVAVPYLRAHHIKPDQFKGIPLAKLDFFEDHFEVNVEVYSLNERETESKAGVQVASKRVRRSRQKYESTMYLNLYSHQFSYINDICRYSDCYECSRCRKLFVHRGHFNAHEVSCNITTKLVFSGGGYGLRKNVFELLAEHGIDVEEEMRYYPFRMCFDYEAMCVPVVDERGKKQKFMSEQVPASCAVASNVPGFTEPCCFVSEGDPGALVAKMYQYMQEISMAAYDILCERYERVINEIDYYVNEREMLLVQRDELIESENFVDAETISNEAYKLNVYAKLSKKFDEWLSKMPTFGFNSGKYDLNLIRSYLFPYLLRNNIEIENVIKKENDYLSITTPHVLFLDAKNFVAPGTSYAGWLKSNRITEGKGIFPYSWFKSLDLLDQPYLPSIEEFWSDLKQSGITEVEYEKLQDLCTQKQFKCMRDLLIHYNNMDVSPFLIALSNMYDLWVGQGIDPFKSTISLPGLALSYLMKAMQRHTILPLYDDRTSDVHQTLRDNIVGGLAIVITRYAEKDVTILPNGQLCKYVCSLDANSLYLWALGEATGTGLFAVWRPHNPNAYKSVVWIPPPNRDPETEGEELRKWNETRDVNLSAVFHRKQAYPHSRSEVNWLEWVSYRTGRRIEHRFNGREKRVPITKNVHYSFDGYHPESQTAYFFHGCFWHGHGHGALCRLDKNRDTEDQKFRRDRTETVMRTLQDMGFTLEVIWECEWMREMSSNPQIYRFLEEHLNLKMKKTVLTGSELLEAIDSDNIFGMLECDIEVPWYNLELLDYFSDFPPIYKNITLTREDLGDHMRTYAEERGYMTTPTKCLINSYFGAKITLITPLVRWYMRQGLIVTRIYQFIEFKGKTCFANIRDEIADHRRKTDVSPDYAPIGNNWKCIGNSMYGKTMRRKDRDKDTVVVEDAKAAKLINDKKFNKMCEVGDSAYEICLDKDKIDIDLPLSVAAFVYQYSKLKMLEFVYCFLKRYLRPGSYILVASDTDSIIGGFASENIDDLVKDELKDEYFATAKAEYLVTDDYSLRTPGKLKKEWEGLGIVALCSKTYITWSGNDKKISSKGLSKRTNDFSKEDYMKVLRTKLKGSGTNYGFRLKGDKLFQYRQEKDGLAYLYGKRVVQSNHVNTKPLYL